MLGLGKNGNTASMGLLELRLGRNGAGMAIGSGGVDASLGNIASAIRGIGVLGTNARINSYVKSEGLDIAAALRSQYGFGDKAQKTQLKEILKGRTQVVAGSGSGEAETVSSGGQRTVYLNNYREGMSLAEQMALGVVLGHEAYRDGKNNGAVGQKLETQEAVKAHTEMLVRMIKDGQGIALNDNLMKDLGAYARGDAAFSAYVDTTYSSKGDKWLVKLDGNIVGTVNDPKIYRQVHMEDGRIVKQLVPGSNEIGSQALALVGLLGEQRVLERLGDETINQIPEYLSDTERKKLIGEMLLERNGYTWDQSKGLWEGEGLNIANVPVSGDVGLVKQDGSYYPFEIVGSLFRINGAFDHFKKESNIIDEFYKMQKNEWNRNDEYIDNVTISFIFKDLITGNKKDYKFDMAMNSIDNMITNGGINQEYDHMFLGTIQGATVARGSMELKLFNTQQWNTGDALLFTNYYSIAGDYFGSNGRRSGLPSDPRTWMHPTLYGGSDSCFVNYGQSNVQNYINNINYLKNNFNLYNGYSIKSYLYDLNFNAIPGLGKKVGEW